MAHVEETSNLSNLIVLDYWSYKMSDFVMDFYFDGKWSYIYTYTCQLNNKNNSLSISLYLINLHNIH